MGLCNWAVQFDISSRSIEAEFENLEPYRTTTKVIRKARESEHDLTASSPRQS